jgi:hypothetical protein
LISQLDNWETDMRNKLLLIAALGGLTFMPLAAHAEGGAAAGAATGVVGGAIVGGPIGAVVGGVAGAAVGGSADRDNERRTVVVEPDDRPVRERTCVSDSYGNKTCNEVVR